MAAAPVLPPSTWERIESDAGTVWDYYESPVTDAAAVIGVEAAWLTAFLVAVKALAVGLHHEFRDWSGVKK
jgi:hypothetical protein